MTSAPRPPVAVQATSDIIPIEADDAVFGDPNADVTIVVFSDLQCPFCGRAAKTIDRLREKYRPDKLRIVVKHYPLPFHKQAKLAAQVAQAVLREAGPQGFLRFTRLAYGAQRSLSRDRLFEWAESVGAHSHQLDAPGFAREVERDMALAQRLGVSGTPAFFVNGTEVSGAQPLEKFVKMIDEELDQVQELKHAGTPIDQLYARRVDVNTPPPEVKGVSGGVPGGVVGGAVAPAPP